VSIAPVIAVLWSVAGLLVTAVLAVVVARARGASGAVYCLTITVSAITLIVALAHLFGGGSASRLAMPLGVPWVGSHFRVDALASVFLVVVNLGGFVASLYALGYGRHEPSPERILPFYPAFLAGMNLVVVADDAFTFLVSWEFMSLASWALVMAHHREGDNARAGFIYIVMASAGTLALLLAFGLLAGPEGAYSFDAIRSGRLTPPLTTAVLALVLLGAGSKAGIVPLHVWLPLAHPAAPSHVSALMSGVMTKVATYAFIRIVFDLVGPIEWWWGTVVLVVGGVTAVMGVLHALMQHDLKRLLAYHTVENIGIIFVGLGLALAFRANAMDGAAALAFTAALFHVLNHSVFKSLLFLGSGAVLAATGHRDMDKLGGLIHRMPATSFAFLIGAAAISALPPLNGFVSEWLVFQAILLSPDLPQWDLKILVPAVGALLALSAALAAACFVKAFGVSFLGRPRSPAASVAHETDRFSLAAMLILASLCLLAGVLPGFVIDALAPAAQIGTGAQMPAQSALPWLSIIPVAESRSSYNGLLLFLLVAGVAAISSFAIHRLASGALRRAPAWDCGSPDPDPATQYTAGSFAQPIRRIFGTIVFGARERLHMPPPGDPGPARFEVRMTDAAWEGLYAPLARAVTRVADRLNPFQFLTIRRYLALVLVALVALLALIALRP